MLYQAPRLLLADEPVSALDPTLADAAVGELVAQNEASGATLVASLHAVDLALRWFPRIVGVREGRIAFDLSAEEVTPALLHELYAAEGAAVPVQGLASPEQLPGLAATAPRRRGGRAGGAPAESGAAGGAPGAAAPAGPGAADAPGVSGTPAADGPLPTSRGLCR